MSRSKQSTPAANVDHPANELTFVDDQIKQQLLKTPVKLLLEDDTYKIQLNELRNNWKYSFCLQWLFFFRGASRLTNETITVDLIEEELVGLTEENLMIKIPVALAATLIGSKVTIDDFSYRVRFLLGDSCKLLGTEEAPIEFKSLSFVDKFSLFYELIQRIQKTDNFRAQVEKYENDSELRFDSIFEKNESESYYLLSDNRIYLRTLKNWPKLKIPKKHKHARLTNPEEDLRSIDPELEWECVAIGIYEIHAFLDSIKSNRSMKPLFQNIKDHIDELANEDLQTRKKILKRKRENEMTQMLSSRKRSSRIQMKEEQMKAEQERLAAEAEEQAQRQLKARRQRKLKQKEKLIKEEIEERLRRTQSSTSRTRTSRMSHLRESTPSSNEPIPTDNAEATITTTTTTPTTTETKPENETVDVDAPEPIKLNIDAIELKELQEGEWLFQCHCNINQKNYDDGTKQIVCEKCGRWQHLKCQPRAIQQEMVHNAEEPFICSYCKEDFEIETIEKLEQEEILRLQQEEQRRLELIEKQKQKELAKIQRQEEQRQQEELERHRKEEIERERERERERRVQERREALAAPTSSSSAATAGQSTEKTPDLPQMGTFNDTATLPSLGTFTATAPSVEETSQPTTEIQTSAKEEGTKVESQTQDVETQPLFSSQPDTQPLSSSQTAEGTEQPLNTVMENASVVSEEPKKETQEQTASQQEPQVQG